MGSVDEVVQLKPNLVIGSVPYKAETVAKLLEHPLNFLAMNPRSLEDVENDVRILGGLVNRTRAAERLIHDMRAKFTAVKKRVRPANRIRVYCEAWSNPRISSPPWVAELVHIAGGEMSVPAGSKVTDEQVAAADPELIVLAWAATGKRAEPEKAYEVEAWKNVTAIRQRRVHVISDELLNTPGPPLVRGVQELAKLIRAVAGAR